MMSKSSSSARCFRSLGEFAKRLYRGSRQVSLRVDQRTKDIAASVARDLGKEITCILYYPHLIPREKIPYPFTRGGIVVVFTDDVISTVDLILRVYAHIPPDLSLIHI